MSTYFLIALGSALGGGGRYWVNAWVNDHAGTAFPWGTLSVNCIGALFVGLITAAILAPEGLSAELADEARWGLVIGLCGSFTTVSSFSLQTLSLARNGRRGRAVMNVAGTVSACLLLVWLGLLLGRLIWGLA